ncbi:FimV/HubP family polar landmark protein [Rhodoferax sp. PAMC 29310]|uniref:FimV/HubP family polar landmark protein n=1 Tax=Rhodoferax sp. PAMC 29310 TaxID=2822760 RepID=UPI001B341A12|nr:FimV/HubP family polar landmark protein [Rhodoferax sp. PAMC 29310]
MNAKSHRWQKTVLAAAASALLGLAGSNASALSLGRITVQSALGEPLRAEIDIPEINAEEAASLKAAVAQPAAFQAAGMEYNPAMGSLKTSLQTRPNGRAFIRLSSDRAINEPFVDMILEATWASGRIVRDYTMLFDPAPLKKAPPTAPSPVQAPTQAPAATSSAPAPRPNVVAPAKAESRPAERPTPTQPAPVTSKPQERVQKIKIKAGDTASGIAATILPANVSLDQMLVAMLRANPDAFIRDNVNRMKAGAVLEVPTEAQANATPESEASQMIVAQSRDFNDFRRKLASNAPDVEQAAADRQASGRLQAQVDDKKTETPAPDKLTLSKGSVETKIAEDQLAKDRAAADAASRAAELTKNINDLGKLGVSANSSSTSAQRTASAAEPAPAALAVPAALPDAPPKEPAPVVAPAVEPAAPVAAPAPSATPAAEPGFVDDLIENPLVPAGAAGLVVLLAALGIYRMRQRKNKAHVDSSFMESHLKPESFFGASGGQSVDTSDSGTSGSSMVYSPSQLVADDVDPLAEADVYLAYGRDLQAEEILREALRTQPGRIAIHQKLVDIFAKRNDAHGLEEVAALAFKLTGGTGAEWARICELGLGIDPSNSLYQPGGEPLPASELPTPENEPQVDRDADDNSEDLDSARATLTPDAAEENPSDAGGVDLDLDLDFSFEEQPSSQITEALPSDMAPVAELPSIDDDASALDSVAMTLEFEPPTEVPLPAPAPTDKLNDINFDLSALDDLTSEPAALDGKIDTEEFKVQAATSFGTTEPGALTTDEPEDGPNSDLSMLDFDLDGLSLDLNTPESSDANAAPVEHEDPLMTKLALAEEFSAIGDDDGARALIEEVLSEATGDMKAKAQRALGNL